MKITFLLQSFPCLSETFILNQITGLIDLGCEVRIIAFGKSGDPKQHPDVARYRLLDKTIYIQPPKSKSACRFKAAVQTLSGFLRHPIFVYRLQKKLLADGRSYFYPKLFMALAVIRQRADIIHCHYGPTGQQAVFLKDIGLKIKISTVFHGYDLSMYLNEHGSDIYRELFEKGDLFLPVSEFWKQKLIGLGCPAEKSIVHHMGIDTAIFKPGVRGRDSERTKILTVARLTEKKGHRYALEAFRRAIDVFPQLEYHIAGDGPLFEDIKKLTREWGIENHVIFHGKVDAEEALQLYKNADIFLLSSVTSSQGDMEGIPVSLMEAMACGLPVIATAHSGIPELVIDGQTGYLVPEKDIMSIANRIVSLASNFEFRSEIGCYAANYVKLHFNKQKLTNQLLEFLNMLIVRSTQKIDKQKWKSSIKYEVKFWDDYFRTKGLQWKDYYSLKLDPNLPLQPEIVELLPKGNKAIKILDVGAGPLTYLGKKIEGRELLITVVDPLAKEYDKILKKYKVQPIIRTEKLDAEKLTKRFSPETFDLVFARNCIDHAYSPEKAILEMIAVVKTGDYVLMMHRLNEGEKENYRGLHQWNFSMTPIGDFCISSKNNTVNFSEKYKNICKISCTFDPVNEWLITKILKK